MYFWPCYDRPSRGIHFYPFSRLTMGPWEYGLPGVCAPARGSGEWRGGDKILWIFLLDFFLVSSGFIGSKKNRVWLRMVSFRCFWP